MADCIFCKIIAGTIPCKLVFDSPTVLAFHDIHPQAPVHILIVPKRHVPTFNDLTAADAPLLQDIMQVVQAMAKQHGIAERGYRLIINTNDDGGQEVFHLHVHLLGGQWIGPMVSEA